MASLKNKGRSDSQVQRHKTAAICLPVTVLLLTVSIGTICTCICSGKRNVVPKYQLVASLFFVVISLTIKYGSYCARFEVLIMVLLNIHLFWYVTPCRMVNTDASRVTTQSTYEHDTVSKPRHWSIQRACLRAIVLYNPFLYFFFFCAT
jgi:hypothetical protein